MQLDFQIALALGTIGIWFLMVAAWPVPGVPRTLDLLFAVGGAYLAGFSVAHLVGG